MKRTLFLLAAAGLGLVPGLALADTSTVKVDSDHSVTAATAAPGADRDILTPEDILAIVAKSKPAMLVAPEPAPATPPAAK